MKNINQFLKSKNILFYFIISYEIYLVNENSKKELKNISFKNNKK